MERCSMSIREKRAKAKTFSKYWEGRGYEKGESQSFWLSLLGDVLGIQNAEQIIKFEEQVKLDNTSFIDGHISETNVLIEQKSISKDLKKPIKQSDGTFLTPFQQAKRYSSELPYSVRPRWIVACNFKEIFVYDMENPSGEPEIILLKDLGKEYYRLEFLIAVDNSTIKKEMEISVKAGELVGILYDEILKQYRDPTNIDSLKSLNKLCVRLVFCLYAEDAGLFGERYMFHNYLKQFSTRDVRDALIKLFRVLNTKEENRDYYLDSCLATFPYVNGGLFSDGNIEIPQFTDTIVNHILVDASENFDWSEISPTIFGAVFESTLNQETRRKGGMHYTSIENIHKVIDSLFLNDLKSELEQIKAYKIDGRTKDKRLLEFQNKLASLIFFDPACGSGNFLTETYLSLRRMENESISLITAGQQFIGYREEVSSIIKVSIQQFYGIEINDFAVTVATTALWIAESQMIKETEKIIKTDLDFLPLKSYTNIYEGNALRVNWEEVISHKDVNYIIGNPPFLGARNMNNFQKDDMKVVFGKLKNLGNLDYVTAWYWKATSFIENTLIRVAFVSTNSITQGEQPAIFFKPIMEKENGIKIDFAYRTFIWSSGANSEAHVHCVIIGFSGVNVKTNKFLYSKNFQVKPVKNINSYLLEASNVFIESRNKPLFDVPKIGIGNKPIDGGFYLFSKDEMNIFIKKEPLSKNYFHRWYGAKEFLRDNPRYCLYLGNCSPVELSKMPECLKRVKAVMEYRLNSISEGTRRIALTPTHFHVTNIPNKKVLVIPTVTSQRRLYVPIGFLDSTCFCSDAIRFMVTDNLYYFGVISSIVNMTWLRAFGGRLKSDFRYSVDIVYNTFPWPNCTENQKDKIKETSLGILEVRKTYKDCNLTVLYDPITMPQDLRKAHEANDKAVMRAYGFAWKMPISDIVTNLIKLYEKALNRIDN